MAADDEHDRLIDALLWELHGDEASPELRARVLAAAFPTRRRAVVRTLGAAAAVLLAAVVGWMALRGRTPRPRAEGDFALIREGAAIDPASSLRRGDRLVAGAGGVQLHLGGYCELQLDPDGELIVRGEPGKEAVELEKGKLASRIVSERGEFRVVTPLGWLDVRGTKFVTSVEHREAAKGANTVGRLRKHLVVGVVVLSGIVAFQFGESTGLLGAGMSQAFGAEEGEKPSEPPVPEGLRGFRGIIRGPVLNNTEGSLILRIDRIQKVWQGSKAKDPGALKTAIGKLVRLGMRAKAHARVREAFAAIKMGDHIEAGVMHTEDGRLTIVELLRKLGADAPKEETEKPKEEPRLLEGARGFKGIFVGTLVEKGEATYVLKVEKVTKAWKNSAAKNPESVVGTNVKMTLRWKGRVRERLVPMLRELKAGDRVEVGASHVEADVFANVELLKKAD